VSGQGDPAGDADAVFADLDAAAARARDDALAREKAGA
jgi:hypothetical protein